MNIPNRDHVTGEWYYRGKWYASFPEKESERDEAAEEDWRSERSERLRMPIDRWLDKGFVTAIVMELGALVWVTASTLLDAFNR